MKPYESFDVQALKRLWIHESSRVIMDRLLELEDKELFMKILSEITVDVFDNTLDDLIDFLNPDKTDKGDLSAHRRLFFGNYLDINAAEPLYVEIEDVEGLVQQNQRKFGSLQPRKQDKMDFYVVCFCYRTCFSYFSSYCDARW